MSNTQISTEIKVVKAKITTMQEKVEAVDIKDGVAVKEMVKNIKKLLDYVEQEKAKYVDPAKLIIDEAKEQYDPYILACKEAKKTITDRATAYIVEQRKIEDEQKEKLAARVEKGTMKEETAVAKMSEIGETKPSYAGVTVRMISVATIENPELVPDKYWIIDEVRVRKEALAGVEIPGVKVEKKASGGFSR